MIRLPGPPGWDYVEGELCSLLRRWAGASLGKERLLHGDLARAEPGAEQCLAYLRLEPSCSLLELPVLCPSSGL